MDLKVQLRGIRLDRPKPHMYPKVGYRMYAHLTPPLYAVRDRFALPPDAASPRLLVSPAGDPGFFRAC